MSSDDRKSFETATAITQDFLDTCHDNLLNELRLVVKIGIPPYIRTGLAYTNPSGTIVRVTAPGHRIKQGDIVTIANPTDVTLDGTHTVDVISKDVIEFDPGTTPSPATGTLDVTAERFIYVSDRNTYVGSVFYPARTKFPVIRRTVGEYISPVLEFETLTLEINNTDEEFNDILQTGDSDADDFQSWIGNSVTVQMGLRDVASTYIDIFGGTITPEAGYNRTVKSINIVARNNFDKINTPFPSGTGSLFVLSAYPDLEEDKQNLLKPLVYGDWTENMEPDFSSIPAIPVNGADEDVNGGEGLGSFTNNVQLVISINANTEFDDTNVYLKRGDSAWLIPSSEITNVNGDKNYFEIEQQGPVMTAITPETDDVSLEYNTGDEFYVRVKGKSITGDDTNIVAIARDILLTYGGLSASDFDASWATFEAKATPAVSAISTFKARAYIFEQQTALAFALSLLEQVRLEAFIDRNLKVKLLSTHLEDFIPPENIDHNVQNWHVGKGSFNPQLDARNNFNRCKGQYNYLPNRNELFRETGIFRNQAAIDDIDIEIAKRILFPNLVDGTVVENQVKEILRITTSYLEYVDITLTWRALLLDIGDFVKLNVKIGSTQFDNVPAVIREIGYDPFGLKLPARLWSLQMVPFTPLVGPAYNPGHNGITGGSTATIAEET